MKQFARTCLSKNHEVFDIRKPYSFFQFIDSRFGSLYPLRRILSQVRAHHADTMVLEELRRADDLTAENEDIQTRYPDFAESHSWRLSFFAKPFSSLKGLSAATDEHFLGYAIVKFDRIPSRFRRGQWRVYESVVRPSRHANNFTRGMQRWKCRVAGEEFRVPGYLYAQQNDMTNVCAHVALRTVAARYHPDGDMSYREMNQLVDIDHRTKKAGGPDGQGLFTTEMVRILESAGARCFVGDYSKPEDWPVPFDKYVYGSMESGFPSIVVFSTTHPNGECHAIPVFGHTFNEDAWVASADFSYFRIGAGTAYIPSASWLSMYVAHDDNWGSNFCIPRRYLDTKRVCKQSGHAAEFCPQDKKGVAYVIATVPAKAKLDPVRAEAIGADYLFNVYPQMPAEGNPWRKRLREFARRHMLILRPVLIEAQEYVAHLARVKDWEGNRIKRDHLDVLRSALGQAPLWLIELSIPELFSANRRKVGEILLRSDIEPGATRDMRLFLLARVPGNFAAYEKGGPSNPLYRFTRNALSSHVELFGCEESAHPDAG